MARRLPRSLALVLSVAACSGDAAPGTTTPTGSGTAAGTGGGATGSAGIPGGVTVTTHRRGGTPHHAVIDLVELSADGRAAISRDAIGEWRIWPALDGTMPTQRIPLNNAIDAAVSTTAAGFLVAAVDAADGLELLQLGPDGTSGKRTKFAPEPGIEHVVLAGDRVIAALADQSIVVLDRDAVVRGKLTLRGARVEALVGAGPDRVLALLRKAGASPTFETRWIKLDAKAVWGESMVLPTALADSADLAVSPDGRLLAYASVPLPPAPAESKPRPDRPAGEAAAPMPPPPPPSTVQITIIDLKSGKTLPVGDPNNFSHGVVLGFMTARDLMVVDASQGSRIAIDADAGTTATFGDGLPVRTGPTAFAPGVAAAGQLASLVVVGSDGTVKYLGHRDSAPTTGSISPSGRTAAWLSTAGSLIVERFSEDTEHVIMPDNHTSFSLVELVDDATVIVLSNQSVLQMFDVDSGTALGDTPVTAAAAMQYSAKTKLLLVPSGNTVWLYAIDRTTAAPFGKRMVVPESSAFLLDPDAAGGTVLLGSDGGTIRKYTMDELVAGVSRAMARDGRITLPTSLYIFDRVGRPYNIAWRSEAGITGRFLESWPANGKTDPWQPKGTVIAKIPDDVSAAIPAPNGDRYLAYDNRGTLMMFDPRGAITWSAAMPTMPSRISWSDDGSRLMVVSQSGGEVFDAATGASLERACGWRFTADVSPPMGGPTGIASVCTAAVRR